MKAEIILDAVGMINDEAVRDAGVYRRPRFGRAAKWGTIAACFSLILIGSMAALPTLLKEPGNAVPPPNPAPGPVIGTEDNQPSSEPLLPPEEKAIVIHCDNVAVNESEGIAIDAARRCYDSNLYDLESWTEEEIVSYYGWDLAPGYLPDGFSSGGGPGGFLCREKSTGRIIEDQAGRSFGVAFWEDGSPKSDDDLYIAKRFSITASRLGILHCGLLRADDERTTDFGGVDVTISHRSMSHGPFDPTRKAPDGLSNMPAGYYDLYVASFTLDGTEYEIEAIRLELEEVVKITASVIGGLTSQTIIVENP